MKSARQSTYSKRQKWTTVKKETVWPVSLTMTAIQRVQKSKREQVSEERVSPEPDWMDEQALSMEHKALEQENSLVDEPIFETTPLETPTLWESPPKKSKSSSKPRRALGMKHNTSADGFKKSSSFSLFDPPAQTIETVARSNPKSDSSPTGPLRTMSLFDHPNTKEVSPVKKNTRSGTKITYGASVRSYLGTVGVASQSEAQRCKAEGLESSDDVIHSSKKDTDD